jgi:hypothetical protein
LNSNFEALSLCRPEPFCGASVTVALGPSVEAGSFYTSWMIFTRTSWRASSIINCEVV